MRFQSPNPLPSGSRHPWHTYAALPQWRHFGDIIPMLSITDAFVVTSGSLLDRQEFKVSTFGCILKDDAPEPFAPYARVNLDSNGHWKFYPKGALANRTIKGQLESCIGYQGFMQAWTLKIDQCYGMNLSYGVLYTRDRRV